MIPSFPSTDPLPEITWRKPFQFTYEVDIRRYPPFLICPRAGRGQERKLAAGCKMKKPLKKMSEEKASTAIRAAAKSSQTHTKPSAGDEYFREFFENAAAGLVIVDRDRNFLAVNNRYCEITGYSRKRLLTMNSGQIVYPDDKSMDIAEIGRLVSGESRSFVCDLRYIHASGSILWVHKQVSVLRSPEEEVKIIAVVEDVTKRKRMEEEFHNAELGLRSVLDSSRDVIYRLNLKNGRYEYISPSCEAVVGYSLDKVMSLGAEAIKSLIQAEDLPGLREKLARLEVTGKEEVEARFYKDGEYRWLSNRMFLIRDRSGRPLYRDGTIRDITSRKRTEANLAFLADIQDDLAKGKFVDEIMQSVGAKIGAFLDVAFSFFAEIDPAGDKGLIKYIWHSHNVSGLPETIRLSDFVHPEPYKALQERESFIIRDTETDPRSKPGPFRTLSMRSFILMPYRSYAEWKIVLVIADKSPRNWRDDEVDLLREVSNRVFPRLERARAENALRESEERFRSAFEKGAVPMAMTGPDSRIMTANAAFQDLLGYSDAEIANLTIYEITHPDDIAENKPGIEAIMRGEKDSFRMEKRYIRKDGRTVWVDMSTSSVCDASGRMLYLVTHAQDITDRKKAEEELEHQRELLKRLFEKMQNQGE